MVNMNLKTKPRKTGVLLCAMMLTAVMLFSYGCDSRRNDVATEQNTGAATVPDVTEAVTGTTHDPEIIPDPDVEAYSGLVISKVYGNGGNSTAACEHSFIELTNTGTEPLDLGCLAVYYRSGTVTEYSSLRLPDVKLNGGKSFLIRGVSASKRGSDYDASYEVIRITDFDMEWELALDNKDIKLVLAGAGKDLDITTPPEQLPGMISYFVATEEYCFDTGYVSDYSKNKVAVRTALKKDSGYYLQNLTKATTEKLAQVVPTTSDGKTAEIIGSKLVEVKFSYAAGFYSSPLELELTAPEGYDTIYYTTDGSDPSCSEYRKEYKKAITLQDTKEKRFGRTYVYGAHYVGNISSPTSYMLGAHVIKACAYNGTDYTGVYTNSYFINSDMAEYGVTVMSVSLEKDQMFGDPGFYHNFDPVSNEPNTRGMAFMEVFDKNGVRRGYSNVELAVSGHGSSGAGMRSMKVFYKGSENTADGTESKLNFDLFDGCATNSKGQCITDFSRLLLRNSGNDCGVSYIRDSYMQRVSSPMYADTMAYTPVLVFINGDFWGIYNARERYSGDYVESHYGIEKDNVALIESDYSLVHTDQNAPFIVTSGLENDADDFNDLVSFIRSNSLESEENYNYVLSKMDVDSLIDLFISRIYFSSLDFPGNNIKVWRNRADDDPSGADNRWHFVMLDMDMGISFYKGANDTTETSNYIGWLGSDGTVASTLINHLLSNSSFRIRFLSRYYQVLNEIYVPSLLEAELDNIVSERASIEYLQSQRWGASMDTYNSAIADMRRFVQKRNGYALRFLCSYFGVNEEYLMNISGSFLSVNFSETRLDVTVDGEEIQSPWTKQFENSLTVNIKAKAKEGFELKAIVFTDGSGNVTRYESGEATVTTEVSGQISFETKKVSQPVDLTVRSGIVAGGCEMYYLSDDGKLYAWGSNNNNVLGAGASRAVLTEPELVREGVAQIEICHSNDLENDNNNVVAAILTLDGDIYTIGAQVIPGVNTGSSWTLLEYDGSPVAVSVGFDHLIVLDKDGSVWGIGNNSYGQLGKENEGGSVTSFVKIADNAVMISAGRRNSAYLDANGDCYVLGDGRWHKFRASEENITSPYKVLSGVSCITSGEHELLMVTEDGKLYYAGWRTVNGFGQGGGSYGAQQIAVSGVSKAAIHHGDIAIMTETGALYVYGVNNGGCIGAAVVGGSASMLIKGGVKDVAAGFAFIAYVDENGAIRINGSNTEGQAGIGNTTDFESWSTVVIGK